MGDGDEQNTMQGDPEGAEIQPADGRAEDPETGERISSVDARRKEAEEQQAKSPRRGGKK